MTTETAAFRNDLIKACNLARLRLDAQALGPMISRSQFDRVADHLIEVLSVTELIPSDDFDALKTALEDEVARRDLAIAINGLLHGKRMMDERFKHAHGVFAHHDLARWSLLTAWLFLLHSDRYMLIDSPDCFASEGADALPAAPSWPGFRESQKLALRLKKQRGADDMIALLQAIRG